MWAPIPDAGSDMFENPNLSANSALGKEVDFTKPALSKHLRRGYLMPNSVAGVGQYPSREELDQMLNLPEK
jgi:hypothetical protein